jgi:hypothetical protein
MFNYADKFTAGLSYDQFLVTHGTAEQRQRWSDWHQQIQLTEAQISLLRSFKRNMPVICFAGAWCGDCVQQCPIFDHFANISTVIDIRYFDRDTHPDLGAELKICGGARVPVVMWLSEDFQPVGWLGDRTLAKYRQLAEKQLGPACPTGIGGVDQPLLQQVIQEWLNEFERCQLLLRLSPRLRQLHGD